MVGPGSVPAVHAWRKRRKADGKEQAGLGSRWQATGLVRQGLSQLGWAWTH